MVDRQVGSIIEKASEQRSHLVYFDALGTFDLVFQGKIKSASGEASGLVEAGER